MGTGKYDGLGGFRYIWWVEVEDEGPGVYRRFGSLLLCS